GFWCILHLQFEEAFRFNQTIFITFPLFIFCILYWTFNMDFRKFKRNLLGI
ncbi:PF10825 family protein, partial [Leptospira interrogans serovar Pyrogenes str. 200701872]